jgi:hypothetical protein
MARTRLLVRLEPRDGTDLSDALAARVWDPLWMLARQWQFGELLATFAGAPVSCSARTSTIALTHARPGEPAQAPAGWPAVAAGDPDPATALLGAEGVPPLAVLAEAQAVRSDPSWSVRLRASTGLRFADELAARDPQAAAGLAAGYPLAAPAGAAAPDEASLALLGVLAGRVPDGQQLYAELAASARAAAPGWPLPARLATADPQRAAAVRDAAQAWVGWCDTTVQEPVLPPSWSRTRLDHRMTVAAASSDQGAGTAVLAVTHDSEELDWYSFETVDQRPADPTAPAPVEQATPALVPTALRFPGMPTPRWWETDDAAIDLGAVDASAADLARLLVLEYALAYGNDFFLIPIRVPADSLTTVTELLVVDSFGVRTSVPPAAEVSSPGWASWRMFTVSDRRGETAGARPALLLVARPPAPVVGAATDEGQLVRDEMANLAWLVEARYAGGDGVAVSRSDAPLSDLPTPEPAEPDHPLQWTLSVTPPPHWVPYAPAADADHGVALVRAAGSHALRGRLADTVAGTLPDRLVPREGLLLRGGAVFTRDHLGRPYVWWRMQRRVGRGDTSSGLAYDVVRPAT